MNLIMFQKRFPNVNRLYRKVLKGDIDTRFLLARYNHARGAREDAFRGYHSGAERGHATSMYYVGMEFYCGEVTSRSYRKALMHFVSAARLGEARSNEEYDRNVLKCFEAYFPSSVESAYMAGRMFEQGLGARKSIKKAIDYYEMAIDQAEHASAMVALATLQLREMGPQNDLREVIDLLNRASEKGEPSAFYELGMMYAKGGHLDKDPGVVAEYLWKAASRGHGGAAFHLAHHFYEGDGIKQDLVGALLWLGWADFLGSGLAKHGYDEIRSKLSKEEISHARRLFSKARANYRRCGFFDIEP